MSKYSHTRLGTYDNCPLQYRFKYLDKIESPFEQTDSTFLGSRCHGALEKLYKDRMIGIIDTKEEILNFFDEQWDEKYNFDEIMHTEEGKSGEYYRRLGRGWIERYYDDFFVNDEMEILGIETDDTLVLPNGTEYYIRIDKLGFMNGTYYVCDYKTDKNLKTQEVADNDRQLAMYALWVRRTFPDANDVRLLWQMLRFTGENAQVISERTAEQLDQLEKDVVSEIERIESTKEFLPSDSAYCDYCTYKQMCPRFAPPKVLTMEDAAALVDELVRNRAEAKVLEDRKKEIESELSSIVSENECDRIAGSEKDLSVSRVKNVVHDDRDALEKALKEKGLYDGYCRFDIKSVNKDIVDGNLDEDVTKYTHLVDGFTFRAVKKKERGLGRTVSAD